MNFLALFLYIFDKVYILIIILILVDKHTSLICLSIYVWKFRKGYFEIFTNFEMFSTC